MSDETTHSAVFEADPEGAGPREDGIDEQSTGLPRGAPMSVLWWVESTADDLEPEDAQALARTMRRLRAMS